MSIGPQLTFDHPDACFIEALLKLELFDAAIEACRARSKLALSAQPEAAAKWSLLEMHAVAAQAAADPTIVDEPSKATKLLEATQAILERNRESPRLIWLKQQTQWCRWLVLSRLQTAYIAVPARTNIREWSLVTIRECLSELDALQTEIKSTPARDPKLNTKSVTTSEQWSSLSNDIVLLQSDFLFLRALYYPAKSTERIGAATEILSAIEKAELRIGADWTGRPNLDLAKYAALIHLHRPKDALDGIKALDKQLKTSADGKPRQGNRWQTRIATLAAEANRNMGNVAESEQWLESVGGWTLAPELAIEHFANIVTAAEGQTTPDSKIAQALKVKDEIGERFGSYWQQRADAILLANNSPATTATGSNKEATNSTGASKTPSTSSTALPSTPSLRVELFKSEAKQLLAAKRPDEAIEKLNQAEASAVGSGDEATALEMAIAAAAVLDREGRKDDAEGEFHRAAMSYSKQAKAPDCALMSVIGFSKAQVFDAAAQTLSPSEEKAELKQKIYQGRLMDIVNTWSNSSQATQALMKLDRLFLATDQIPELAALWSKRLDQGASWPNSEDNRRKQSVEYDQALCRFVLIATATQDAWMDRSLYSMDLLKRMRAFQEELKGKLIERSAGESGVVRNILDRIVEASRWPNANAESSWSNANTKPWSIAITFLAPIANPSRNVELSELFVAMDGSKMDGTSRLALKWCATELVFQSLIQNGATKQSTMMEVSQLRYCLEQLMLSSEQMSSQIGRLQEKQLERCVKLYRIAIGCWGGNEAAEIETIKSTIESDPKVPWWKYRVARLFQALSTQREQALLLFRQLSSGFPPGSEPWLDVRARTVQTLRMLGESSKAKELTEIVFAAYPSAGKEWRNRFER